MVVARETLEIVAKIKNEITGELGSIRNQLTNVERTSQSAFSQGARAVEGFRTALLGVTGVATGLVAALGARELVQFGASLSQAGSDAEEARSKFEVVFRGLTEDVDAFAKALSEDVNRGVRDLSGGLALFQDTLVPLGLAREEAAELSKVLVELGVDLASFNNSSDEEAFARLQSALVGNVEVLRRYGVALNQANIEQEALRLGLIQTEAELDPTSKALAILSLTIQGSEDAIGDAARTSGSFANTMRGLRSRLADVRAELGQELNEELLRLIERLGGIDTIVEGARIAFTGLNDITIGFVRFLSTQAVPVLAEFIDTAGGLARLAGLDETADALDSLLNRPSFRAASAVARVRELRSELEALAGSEPVRIEDLLTDSFSGSDIGSRPGGTGISRVLNELAEAEVELAAASDALGRSLTIDPQTLEFQFVDVEARIAEGAERIRQQLERSANLLQGGLSLGAISAESFAGSDNAAPVLAEFEALGLGAGNRFVQALAEAVSTGASLEAVFERLGAGAEGAAGGADRLSDSGNRLSDTLLSVVDAAGGAAGTVGDLATVERLLLEVQGEFVLSNEEQLRALEELSRAREEEVIYTLTQLGRTDLLREAIEQINRAYEDQANKLRQVREESNGVAEIAEIIEGALSRTTPTFEEQIEAIDAWRESQLAAVRAAVAGGASIESQAQAIQAIERAYEDLVGKAKGAQDAQESFSEAFRDGFRSSALSGINDIFVNIKRNIDDGTNSLENFGEQLLIVAAQAAITGGIGALFPVASNAEGGVVQGRQDFARVIPGFASGGIVRQPTIAAIAETGQPEAVVPLSGGRNIPVEVRGGMGGSNVTIAPNITVQALDGASGFRVFMDRKEELAEATMEAFMENSNFRDLLSGRGQF